VSAEWVAMHPLLNTALKN